MCPSGGGVAAGTFWATWLTQGEVQLLRSGPRGFQSPRAGRHWKEAIPVGTDTQEQRREPWGGRGRRARAGRKEMAERQGRAGEGRGEGTRKTGHETGQTVKERCHSEVTCATHFP